MSEFESRILTAAQFYEAVERHDYCEILYVDKRAQVKVAGVMQAVGDPKPFLVIGTRGEVLYRLAPEDRAIILVRRAVV